MSTSIIEPNANVPAVATPETDDLRALAASIETSPTSELSDDPELMADFLLESREHLVTVEQNLLELEKNPGNAEALHATFRSFHTIKGLAGFLGMIAVQQVAHETETLLDLARSGSLAISALLIDVILRSSDYLKTALNAIEAKSGVDPAAPAELLRSISEAAGKKGKAEPATEQTTELTTERSVAPPPENIEAQSETIEAAAMPDKAAAGSSLKVDAEKIEHLIDMVGELVIAQSMVRQDESLLGMLDATTLTTRLAHLSRITSEVQKTAMSMRMAPVSALFQKMSRVVRDVARKSGKTVSLVLSGEDAEMDRKILDGLAEPLMHMVRNAIDHGLETPAERVACGKAEAGVVRLRAEREAGNIVIEISDDGRGLKAEKIRRKAIDRGLITEGARLSPEEIHRLIFEPGFSTAETLTEFSGRGVGMDVVRRQVENLRGRVEIRSTEGSGSCFTVRVPLTLATVDGLLIRVGMARYVLPTFTVRKIFRAGDRVVSTVASRAEVIQFRETTIPVVRLAARLGDADASNSQQGVMIVIQSGSKQFCLAVDEVIGKQDVVIKSLGTVFCNQPGIAGGAILGDGQVGLILAMDELLGTR